MFTALPSKGSTMAIKEKVWLQSLIVMLLGLHSAWACPAQGQLLEDFSGLLQPRSPADGTPEELPAPRNSGRSSSDKSILDNSGEMLASGQADQATDVIPGTQTPSDPRSRAYLGLEAEEMTDGIPGLRVAGVTRDSPAWKSGFQENDRIIGIDGNSISKMNDMVQRLGTTQPGQTVKFLINRSGRTLELTTILISAAMAEQILGRSDDETAWLGLVLHNLTPSFREQFGITAFRGAAVTQVAQDSPGQRAGIRAGDAITEIDGNAIESATDVVKWLDAARPGDQANFVIYRGMTRIVTQLILSSEPRTQPAVPSFRPPSQRPPLPGASNQRRTPPPPPEPAPPRRATRPAAGVNIDEPLVPPPAEAMATEKSDRELQLEMEIVQLRQELADAQSKLAEMREQLNNILKSLRE
jgi:membrane-associated protease RseP (regulator of RpoE activity)